MTTTLREPISNIKIDWTLEYIKFNTLGNDCPPSTPKKSNLLCAKKNVNFQHS
jgi:hypothetical protein